MAPSTEHNKTLEPTPGEKPYSTGPRAFLISAPAEK